MFPALQTTYRLSRLIVVLAAVVSLGGLLFPELYRDTAQYRLIWRGNDAVTLVLVVPLLLLCMYWTRRGAVAARLGWLGMLAYMLYNYAFYLFGTAFNVFFLTYVALFTLSLFTLMVALWQLDETRIARWFGPTVPVRWIAGFLALTALLLLLLEGGQCVAFWFTGIVPKPPSLIFALDLSFVVPYMLLGAVLLWNRRPWGYVLAAIMLVKGLTYGAVLVVNSLLLNYSDLPEKDVFWPFYLFVLVGSLAGVLALLRPRALHQPTLP